MNFLFAPCYHCANPVCVPVANGTMMKAKYGAVLIDPAQASSPSLRDAQLACPYGAVSFDSDSPTANAFKCTMCIDRLEQGNKPMCVLACNARALDFDTLANLKTRYGGNSQLSGLPNPSLTNPAVVFTAMRKKTQLIPYDQTEASTLLSQRGGYPALYSSPADVADPTGTYVKRKQELVLYAQTTAESLQVTKNDEG